MTDRALNRECSKFSHEMSFAIAKWTPPKLSKSPTRWGYLNRFQLAASGAWYKKKKEKVHLLLIPWPARLQIERNWAEFGNGCNRVCACVCVALCRADEDGPLHYASGPLAVGKVKEEMNRYSLFLCSAGMICAPLMYSLRISPAK